jgi:ketosteroid isomerase-like protein
MSPLDLVESVFRCGNARDYAALQQLFARDALLDLTRQGLGTYEGAAAIRSFCEGWIEVYEDFALTAVETADLGRGVVLTVNRHAGRYRQSTAEVVLENAWVFVCRAAEITGWTAYDEAADARLAAETRAAS